MNKRILSFILCLLMLASVLTVFAGCSGGITSSVLASDAKAQTIVIATLKDERTTDEAISAVQKAMNEITESEYNTHVVLKLFTEEEYFDKILDMSDNLFFKQAAYEDQLREKQREDRMSGKTSTDEEAVDRRVYEKDSDKEYYTAANGDIYYFDPEYNKQMTLYPTPSEDQLDIIYINSLDLYYELVRSQYIISLEESLIYNKGLDKPFYMAVNNSLITRERKVGDGEDPDFAELYAMPNNYLIPGERYVLINKKLYDYYQYSIECNINGVTKGMCDDFADFIDFMEDVAEGNEKMKAEGSDLYVDKILYNYTDQTWVSYFSGREHLGSSVMLNAPLTFSDDTQLQPDSIFTQTIFKKSMNAVYNMRVKYNNAPYLGECFYRGDEAYAEKIGYTPPTADFKDNKETFAIAMVTGDSALPAYYNSDDYYVVKTSNPVVDNRMFESMFAISTFSSTSLDAEGLNMRMNIESYYDIVNLRCLEILNALMTNADLVNTLTYGVNGYNYDIYENDDRNIVRNLGKNDYYPITKELDELDENGAKKKQVVLGYGGNTFLTYPNEYMGCEELYYSENGWKAAKGQFRTCNISPFTGLVLDDTRENGAAYSALDIEEAFENFYYENIEKVLNFNGIDENGTPMSMENYLKKIDGELKSTPEYEMFKVGTVQNKYMKLPKAANFLFFMLVYRGRTAQEIIESLGSEDEPEEGL